MLFFVLLVVNKQVNLQACCKQTLHTMTLDWKKNLYSVGTVMASKGYPETSTKGCVITGNIRFIINFCIIIIIKI